MPDDLMESTKRTDPNVGACPLCRRPMLQHVMCCRPLIIGFDASPGPGVAVSMVVDVWGNVQKVVEVEHVAPLTQE